MSKERRPEVAGQTFVVLARRGTRCGGMMVGDAPLRRQLERQLSGQPVTFTGHISDRAEVACTLASRDVALNICPAETFGLPVLDALACALPAIVADQGGQAS